MDQSPEVTGIVDNLVGPIARGYLREDAVTYVDKTTIDQDQLKSEVSRRRGAIGTPISAVLKVITCCELNVPSEFELTEGLRIGISQRT